jgi:chromosome partitioning protein
MAKIYTLVNQKGGVGKTTTAINLGAYLARFGQRVLVVDLDPQANATSCLRIDKYSVQHGTYGVLLGQIPANQAMLKRVPREGDGNSAEEVTPMWLIPSSPALAGAEVELVDAPRREFRLRQALEPLAAHFDYILVDCPPSLSLLTVNGLMAAHDGVIIPVQCEYLAMEGLAQLTQTLQRVRVALFPEMKIRGLVMTMFDSRTHLSADVVREVRKVFPNQVFNAIIPRSVRLAEAPSQGAPILEHAPASTGAAAYTALARELLEGDGLPVPAE